MVARKRNPGFQELMAELEAIVQQLESEECTLEASLESFEKGIALTRAAQKLLAEAEQKVTLLTESASGEPLQEPFAEDEDNEDPR